MSLEAISVLEKFYQQTLPLYTSKNESVLDLLDKSDLSAFRYTFSVEAMIKISRIIERAVDTEPNVVDIHASFQYLSRFANQRQAYEHVCRASKKLWLYFEIDVNETAVNHILTAPRVTVVNTTGTPLVDYWFVIAYAPGVYNLLLAREIEGPRKTRMYEGFFTFDANLTYQSLIILHQIFPQQVPLVLPPSVH